MADYIPADDSGLAAWARNLADQISGSEVNYGLVAADSVAYEAFVTAFENNLAANSAAQTAARTARQTKDSSKEALGSASRNLARRLQASPLVSDTERILLGLTVRDTTPTAVPPPTSQPVLFVDTSSRLQHKINFRDSLTPTSKAKPAGVLGCEIYRKVGGTAPADLSQCEFVAMDTATPYGVEYQAEQGGQMVHYLGRWVNRNGSAGPISDLISATVVA